MYAIPLIENDAKCGLTRTGIITPGVGPSTSETTTITKSEAGILHGNMAMQLDKGSGRHSRVKPQNGVMKPVLSRLPRLRMKK